MRRPRSSARTKFRARANRILDRPSATPVYVLRTYTGVAMKASVPLTQAVARQISRESLSVVTAPRLGIIVFKALTAGHVDGAPIESLAERPSHAHYELVLEFLLSYGVLTKIRGLRRPLAFSVLGRPSLAAGEVACAIDPFAYISHLSAMEYHGLTDRVLRVLYLTTPKSSEWQGLAREFMQKELGDSYEAYAASGLPMLTGVKIAKILDKEIAVTHRLHLGAYRKLPETDTRVATVGRTFLDMLREPELCGGMQHVLDTFQDHAQRNLSLITSEIDRHGEPIDKVRAGYVLEEVCGLHAPEIEAWRKFVQRGGSRRLVASKEYSSTFSEKWCLSLNQ